MKVVINRCFGGFSISQDAYKKLAEWGVPVVKYEEQKLDPKTRRYEPRDDGEVIYDRELSKKDDFIAFVGRYWDCWLDKRRDHRLLVAVVEELGLGANGRGADLRVVEIPDGIEWEIDEHDGIETIHEKHRSWTGEEG